MSSSSSSTPHRKTSVLLEPGEFSEDVFQFFASARLTVHRADTYHALRGILPSETLILDPTMLSPEELDDVLRVQATGNLRYVYIISSDISAQIKEKLRSLNPDIQFVFLTKSNAIEKLPIIYDRIR